MMNIAVQACRLLLLTSTAVALDETPAAQSQAVAYFEALVTGDAEKATR